MCFRIGFGDYKSADVDAEGGGYASVFQAASVKGHYEIARLLLVYEADVNTHGSDYDNAP